MKSVLFLSFVIIGGPVHADVLGKCFTFLDTAAENTLNSIERLITPLSAPEKAQKKIANYLKKRSGYARSHQRTGEDAGQLLKDHLAMFQNESPNIFFHWLLTKANLHLEEEVEILSIIQKAHGISEFNKKMEPLSRFEISYVRYLFINRPLIYKSIPEQSFGLQALTILMQSRSFTAKNLVEDLFPLYMRTDGASRWVILNDFIKNFSLQNTYEISAFLKLIVSKHKSLTEYWSASNLLKDRDPTIHWDVRFGVTTKEEYEKTHGKWNEAVFLNGVVAQISKSNSVNPVDRQWGDDQASEINWSKGENKYRYDEKKDAASKASLKDEALKILSSQGTSTQALLDILRAKWLGQSEVLGLRNNVVLLLGNSFEEPTPELQVKYKTLIEKLLKDGKNIIYDADSKVAPLIAQLAGKRSIGISGSKPGDSVFYISNPYIRLKVLGESSRVIMSSDSILGRGLLMENKISVIFDPSQILKEFSNSRSGWFSSSNPLGRWRDDLQSKNINLGISYPIDVPVTESTTSVVEKVHSYYSSSPTDFNFNTITPDSLLDIMSSYSISNAIEYAVEFPSGIQKLEVDANTNNAIPPGAVVFGSSNDVNRYKILVYETAKTAGQAGVTIATGGSGGYMEVANAGAYEAGAHSIGIPLGGFGLSAEKTIASDKHTNTISAKGKYEFRIPWLLHNRSLVIFAPGGSGTVKELATTLVDLAAHPERSQNIVFLSTDYYGVLLKVLSKGMPDSFKSRFLAIDKGPDILKVINEIENTPGFDVSTLRQIEPLTPRQIKGGDFSEKAKSKSEKSDRESISDANIR